MYLCLSDFGLLGLEKLQALNVAQLAVGYFFFVGIVSSRIRSRFDRRLKTRSVHLSKKMKNKD